MNGVSILDRGCEIISGSNTDKVRINIRIERWFINQFKFIRLNTTTNCYNTTTKLTLKYLRLNTFRSNPDPPLWGGENMGGTLA